MHYASQPVALVDGLCSIPSLYSRLVLAQYNVDNGVDIAHIHQAVATDIGIAWMVGRAVLAQHNVDGNVHVPHIDLVIAVDVAEQTPP